MNISDLPFAVLLLLPGFLLLHIMFLTSRIRRISAFHATTWSLIISLLLFVCVYEVFTLSIRPEAGVAGWPSLGTVLTDPARIPVGVWICLYVSALLAGWGIGHADRRGYPQKILLVVGIDLRRHGDIWERTFKEFYDSQLMVYMKDGSLLVGWAKYYTDDRNDPGPEVFLAAAKIWDPDGEDWVSMEHAEGVLIHGSEIGRIEFLLPELNDSTASNS